MLKYGIGNYKRLLFHNEVIISDSKDRKFIFDGLLLRYEESMKWQWTVLAPLGLCVNVY